MCSATHVMMSFQHVKKVVCASAGTPGGPNTVFDFSHFAIMEGMLPINSSFIYIISHYNSDTFKNILAMEALLYYDTMLKC